MPCVEKTISFDGDLYQWVDSARGDVKRSTFINRILRNEMNRQKAVQ